MADSGRLELTWTNKDRTLLAHEDGSYEWVDPADRRVSEVRLLHDVTTFGEVGKRRAADNLLIRGDALHALRSLNEIPEFAKEYVGKVQLCYIDPPFNTGQAFAQYDDALEHSVWLTMIRDRLELIKPLLAPTGSIWVHLDDVEVHRARVVLDEVFGTDNFVATIVWQKRYSRSNDASFSVSHDYLIVYRSSPSWTLANRISRGLDAQYSNPDNDPAGPWRGIPWDAPEERNGLDYPILTDSGDVKRPPRGRHWSGTEANWQKIVSEGRAYFGKAGSGMPNVKRYLSEMPLLVPHTIWTHEEVGHNDEAKKELKALFGEEVFATPKPERLMQRIVHLASQPGEVVLDCFAGSGTTAAVAQKMSRRWVTVERSSENLQKFTMPRLQMVVDGTDAGGISAIDVPTGDGLPDGVQAGAATAAAKTLNDLSRAQALPQFERDAIQAVVRALRDLERSDRQRMWSGGGGFRVLEVGPSMFQEIDGRVYLADWATDSALGEATAAQLGYEYEMDAPFCGRKGKTRLAVVDGLISEAVVRLLVDVLPEGQRLCVCGTAVDPAARDVLRQMRPGSSIKKVPAALLDEYRLSRKEHSRLVALLADLGDETGGQL